jgi:hypothetical protein
LRKRRKQPIFLPPGEGANLFAAFFAAKIKKSLIFAAAYFEIFYKKAKKKGFFGDFFIYLLVPSLRKLN